MTQAITEQNSLAIHNRVNPMSVILGTFFGAAIALGGAYYLISEQNKRFQQLQAEVPPIVVVDLGAIVAKYPTNMSEEEANARMQQTKESFDRLREAGYLVLDGRNVLAAPPALVIPPETFLELSQ